MAQFICRKLMDDKQVYTYILKSNEWDLYINQVHLTSDERPAFWVLIIKKKINVCSLSSRLNNIDQW